MGSGFAVKYGYIQTYTAGAQIYRGATIAIRLGDGLAYPAVDDAADTYKQVVVGFAMEDAAASAEVRVRSDGKLKRAIIGSPAVTVGRLACVYDDESVQLYSSGHDIIVGRITEDTGGGEVYIDLLDRPARKATSAYD